MSYNVPGYAEAWMCGHKRVPPENLYNPFSWQGWLGVLLFTEKVKDQRTEVQCCSSLAPKNREPVSSALQTLPGWNAGTGRAGAPEGSGLGVRHGRIPGVTQSKSVFAFTMNPREWPQSQLWIRHTLRSFTSVCYCSGSIIIAREFPLLVLLKQRGIKSCQTQWELSLDSFSGLLHQKYAQQLEGINLPFCRHQTESQGTCVTPCIHCSTTPKLSFLTWKCSFKDCIVRFWI